MSSPEDIANAFVNHYYTTLNSNPQALAGLYVSFDCCNPFALTTSDSIPMTTFFSNRNLP